MIVTYGNKRDTPFVSLVGRTPYVDASATVIDSLARVSREMAEMDVGTMLRRLLEGQDVISRRLDQVDERLQKVDERVKRVDERSTQRIKKVDEQLTKVDQQLKKINKRLSKIEGDASVFSGAVTERWLRSEVAKRHGDKFAEPFVIGGLYGVVRLIGARKAHYPTRDVSSSYEDSTDIDVQRERAAILANKITVSSGFSANNEHQFVLDAEEGDG